MAILRIARIACAYDLMEVSLDFLCRKYEQMPLRKFVDEKYPEAA